MLLPNGSKIICKLLFWQLKPFTIWLQSVFLRYLYLYLTSPEELYIPEKPAHLSFLVLDISFPPLSLCTGCSPFLGCSHNPSPRLGTTSSFQDFKGYLLQKTYPITSGVKTHHYVYINQQAIIKCLGYAGSAKH